MKRDVEKITSTILAVLEAKGIKIKEENDIAQIRSDEFAIPLGISNRHVHLSKSDLEICFGKGYELTPIKDLSQPGQFACAETVTICGPKGAIEKVRILGPVRKKSQVELLGADNFKLGIKAPLRISGDIAGSAPVTIVGPKGSVNIPEGGIVAKRHIHMTPEDAEQFGVKDGDVVSLEISGERGGIFRNVIVRANHTSKLDCHIDTEEANAMGINASMKAKLVK